MSRRDRDFEVPFEGGEPQDEEYDAEEILYGDEDRLEEDEEERRGEEEEEEEIGGGELAKASLRSGFMAPHKTVRLLINLHQVFNAGDIHSRKGSYVRNIYSDIANQIRAFFPQKSEEEIKEMNFFVCRAGFQGPIRNSSPHDFAISAHFSGSTPILTHHGTHDELYDAEGNPKHPKEIEDKLIRLNSASFVIPGHTASQSSPLQLFYNKKIDPSSRKVIETFEPQLTVPQKFWGAEKPWGDTHVLVQTNTVGHQKLLQLSRSKDPSVPEKIEITKIANEEWVVITKSVKAAVDEKWNTYKGDLKLPDHFNLKNKGMSIFRVHYTPVVGFRMDTETPSWNTFSETDAHGNTHAIREASQANHIINGTLVIDATTCC